MFWSIAWAAIKGAAGWFGGALWSAAQWAMANPLAAALVVSLAGSAWLWHAKSVVEADRDAAIASLKVMTADRDAERANADRAESGRQLALRSNASLLATNRALVDANDKATQLAADAKAAGAAALVSLRRAQRDLAASSARENALRGQLYASDPAVDAWGAQRVPDALAARLLASARSTAGP